jgi:hypothetical protein
MPNSTRVVVVSSGLTLPNPSLDTAGALAGKARPSKKERLSSPLRASGLTLSFSCIPCKWLKWVSIKPSSGWAVSADIELAVYIPKVGAGAVVVFSLSDSAARLRWPSTDQDVHPATLLW